ncbi:MAG: hypothetical protein ACFFBY_03235 [Promethearchaeota archaeon]
METITHCFAGIICQIICFHYFLFPLNIILTIILAVASHIVIDIFARSTYHLSEPQWKDKFWITWQIIIRISAVIVIIFFFFPFWLGMLFAKIPDIVDWRILRAIQRRIYKKTSSSNKDFILIFHPFKDWVSNKFFFWLPNLNQKKYGLIIELMFLIVLYILIYFLLYF